MVKLADIRNAADAKYGSYDIDLGDGNVTKLLNPLRLSDEKRAELKVVENELSNSNADEDADQVAIFQRAIRAVAETEGQADRLLALIGRDLAVLAEVFSGYGANTQAGEA